MYMRIRSLRLRTGLQSTLAADHNPELHLLLHIQLCVRAAEVESCWTLEIFQQLLHPFFHLVDLHQKFICMPYLNLQSMHFQCISKQELNWNE